MQTEWDLVVIGGGAAGFFGALTFADAAPHSRVLICERGSRTLAKVAISGGGRCNVTHHCFDPRQLSGGYPRGGRALIAAFHRWQASDTVEWFAEHGVELKTESDGRMFPVTDRSSTIVECLEQCAAQAGIEIRTHFGIRSVTPEGDGFQLETESGDFLKTQRVLLAAGGVKTESQRLSPGHALIPGVPSLFTFKIPDPLLAGLAGAVVTDTGIAIEAAGLKQRGPVLITHWGLSGPAVLRLSAWGARWIHDAANTFTVTVDWLPTLTGAHIAKRFVRARKEWHRRQVSTTSPFEAIPARLWERLVGDTKTWNVWSRTDELMLTERLKSLSLNVTGKSTHKEEFVTAGGIPLPEVEMKTMESRLVPGLHFAGETLDIDGITGGFNFQAAWTTGRLAGLAIADAIQKSRRERK